MVGTKPTLKPFNLSLLRSPRNALTEWKIFIRSNPQEAIYCSAK
jgi:hypothetical protein